MAQISKDPPGKYDPPPEGCVDGLIYGGINYFGLAVTAGIIFLIMMLPPVDRWWKKTIPNLYTRLFVMTISVILIVYIVNRVILDWKSKHQYCGERFQTVDVTLDPASQKN